MFENVSVYRIRLWACCRRTWVLTRDEVDGLVAGLLTSGESPTGKTG